MSGAFQVCWKGVPVRDMEHHWYQLPDTPDWSIRIKYAHGKYGLIPDKHLEEVLNSDSLHLLGATAKERENWRDNTKYYPSRISRTLSPKKPRLQSPASKPLQLNPEQAPKTLRKIHSCTSLPHKASPKQTSRSFTHSKVANPLYQTYNKELWSC